MKLCNYSKDEKNFIGILIDNSVVCLNDIGFNYSNMIDLIENIDLEDLKKIEFDNIKKTPLDEVKLNAPIEYPKQDIICLGVNYLAHKEESKRYKKEDFSQEKDFAVYFSKRANKIITNNDFIDGHFDIVDSLDYEVELAFIIAKDALNVKKEDAYQYVFGYTIFNDISARNIQTNYKQWYFGKSMDTFSIMHPFIVTKDEIEDVKLDIKSYVNGELRQSSNTELMIYDIPHIIEELSKGFTLKAGTIISTGTPSGVGMGFQPPRFLKSGDEIKCYIEKIGEMKNIVR